MADPDPNPNPAPDPTPDPAPDPAPDPERTFSQADVDRIVQDRLARAKKEPPADYAELKAAAARLAEIEESNKTELEKAVARAEAAEKAREETLAEAKETSLRAAIIAEAAKPDRKVVDTDDVVRLLDRSTLELADDGTPTNIAKAMDALLEAKPHLVAKDGGTRGSADQGARERGGPKQITEDELKAMHAAGKHDEIAQARREGRLASLLGAS